MRSRTIFSVTIPCALVLSVVQIAASETYGGGVTLPEVTPLTRVLQKPADFEGRNVRIEGVVTEVCTEMGCWMALAPGTADKQTMLVQVEHDGVIVFPVSAKGHRAAAQGTLERIGGSAEGREAAAELAAKQPAAEKAPVSWRIKATGAVVY
jgi:uncharacterized protein DUF4920